jgi:hypothetical protein
MIGRRKRYTWIKALTLSNVRPQHPQRVAQHRDVLPRGWTIFEGCDDF